MRRIGSFLSPKRRPVAVFLGAALFSLPGAVRLAQRTIELAPFSHEERRVRELGEKYVSMRALEKTLPPGDVNVLLVGANAIDRGIFVNYYFYPRASHLYFEMPAQTARLPLLVTEAEGPLRQTIVKDPRATSKPHRQLIVPFVAALQGEDGYATEAILETARDTRVTLTVMPAGAVKTYTVRPGEPLILNDVAYELAEEMTTGWLRVRSEEPVRAAFWFVNRARVVATPLPLVTELPPLPQRFAGGEKLWVLNPGTSAVTARVNGREEAIDAGVLRMFSAEPLNEVDAGQPLISFTSTKIGDGSTTFLWPGGIQ
jgi:hypothetical protein